jgi:hypothetical protein
MMKRIMTFLAITFLVWISLLGCVSPPLKTASAITKAGNVAGVSYSTSPGGSVYSTVYFIDGTSFEVWGTMELMIGNDYIFVLKIVDNDAIYTLVNTFTGLAGQG